MRAFEANNGAIQRDRAHMWTAMPPPQQIQPKSDRPLGQLRVPAGTAHDVQRVGHELGRRT